MGWKKLLLSLGIFIVVPAYFLYTPLPDGYSTMSVCKLQLALAARKTMDRVVSNCQKLFVMLYTYCKSSCNAASPIKAGRG